MALYGSDWYRIDTIKEESEASGSDDESDSAPTRIPQVALYDSNGRSLSKEMYYM